jgi:surface protein
MFKVQKNFIKKPPRLRERLRDLQLIETGFSMLEAVVVVGVLLALAIGGFLAYGPITENAKIAKVRSAASEVHTAALVASIDGDPSTDPQGVLDAYNDSTDKIRVEILPAASGGASSNGDFCVEAANKENPEITARSGDCSDVTEGSAPDTDGNGIPDSSDPDIDGDGIPNGSDTTPNGETTGGDTGETPAPEAPELGMMKTTWDTSIIPPYGGDCKTITLPVNGTVSGTVDWGDGTTSPLTTSPSHTYTGTLGPVNVNISGTFSSWGAMYGWTPDCITSVTEWSKTGTTSLANGFYSTTNLASVPQIPAGITTLSGVFYGSNFNGDISGWDTSNVTSMMYAFGATTAFNQNIGTWNTSNVTNMQYTFTNATAFNQNIGNWNTSKVTSIAGMFTDATSFNQDLNGWNTSNITSMSSTFSNAAAFNGNISNWDTSKVTGMEYMFKKANSFNQNLNNWNTSSVQTMDSAFAFAPAFNGDISNWNTSSVTRMNNMFDGARAFNQDVSGWDTSKVAEMYQMFYFATSFNQDLSGWNVSAVTNKDYFETGSALTPDHLPNFA